MSRCYTFVNLLRIFHKLTLTTFTISNDFYGHGLSTHTHFGHSGKSGTIREPNQASGVCKVYYGKVLYAKKLHFVSQKRCKENWFSALLKSICLITRKV